MSDAHLTHCPQCAKDALEKCVTAPSFRLAGSGWYETDFKSGKKKNISQTDSQATNSQADSKANSQADNQTKKTSCNASGSGKE